MKSRPDPPATHSQEECCPTGSCSSRLDRRSLLKLAGLTTAAGAVPQAAAATPPPPPQATPSPKANRSLADREWPVLRSYAAEHIHNIALPVGGIGTGTVSLHGNGSLRDWEVMSRPAKGFTPSVDDVEPFFALYIQDGEDKHVRVVEGPLAPEAYEGSHGSRAPSVNLPRFRQCEFAGGYPFGRVMLSDEDVPLDVDIKVFNPLVPPDAEASGIPVVVLVFELRNKTSRSLTASVCGTLPNFVGIGVWKGEADWKGDRNPSGARKNRNQWRETSDARGLFLDSAGVSPTDEAWGSLALATLGSGEVTHRTRWTSGSWGGPILDFWDDFSADGQIDSREGPETDAPIGSVAVRLEVPSGGVSQIPFLIAWHFPNRYGWNLDPDKQAADQRVGNHYCTRYQDAWDVVAKTAPVLSSLTRRSVAFARTFLESDLPAEIKEAALFNLSTLRTQTCFRIEDGSFFGWEGCADHKGCCFGSCTHVWNYEQTTPYLFGALSLSMRETEFELSTDPEGVMSFRTQLPLARAQEFRRVAADGQMGCVMKMYRDWLLSGEDATLRRLWPKVRKALEFCWIPGGWDADQDGVMEGIQHNTMDVEYFGPNPEIGFWYLGALRAGEEMARHVGDREFAKTCRSLFDRGSRWFDEHLFNGEYYEQQLRPVRDESKIAPYFRVGMGARDLSSPDYQLGSGCLADQLVGQSTAHVCGLGYLTRRENVRATMASIWKYNHRDNQHGHFNPLRAYAIEDEPGLLIAAYPKDRPPKPFPYYAEVWTGIEYTAAAGMLYEGLTDEGLRCVRDARSRYDGRHRSPYDEAECGHHYARAMAAWATVLAYTGFHYSAVDGSITFGGRTGRHFWSKGYAWGGCSVDRAGDTTRVRLSVAEGRLAVRLVKLSGVGQQALPSERVLGPGEEVECLIRG